ncbi:hypothetical protein V2J09_004115 [Rumex salicifolius]
MKIFVKTLKDTHFEIEVKPEDTVADMKKNIETVQGPNKCPAGKQMLIYQGNVLNDDTTLQDNKVAENSFVVIMLTKTKGSPGEGSSAAPTTTKTPITIPLAAPSPLPSSVTPAPVPSPTVEPAPTPVDALPPAPTATVSPTESETGAYSEGASNLVSVTNFNQLVLQILDMGGGTWDRDTVVQALRAAHNIPERAVEYMVYLKKMMEAGNQQTSHISSPRLLNFNILLQQGFPGASSNTEEAGTLDFLRHSPKVIYIRTLIFIVLFQALQAIAQANPQMLQPMLKELGKQNPHIVRLIQEHQADFHRLINEPIEGGECGNIRGQTVTAVHPVPQAIQVTHAERAAIERLEAMGFDRETVLQVYFACNKIEEVAANYLLDHPHEFED